jgi:hypothetical protein
VQYTRCENHPVTLHSLHYPLYTSHYTPHITHTTHAVFNDQVIEYAATFWNSLFPWGDAYKTPEVVDSLNALISDLDGNKEPAMYALHRKAKAAKDTLDRMRKAVAKQEEFNASQ